LQKQPFFGAITLRQPQRLGGGRAHAGNLIVSKSDPTAVIRSKIHNSIFYFTTAHLFKVGNEFHEFSRISVLFRVNSRKFVADLLETNCFIKSVYGSKLSTPDGRKLPASRPR
jgi:hypothetical protein